MKLDRGRFLIASVFIVLGVVFLIGNLDIIDVDVRDFVADWWPVIIIGIGVWVLLGGRTRRRPPTTEASRAEDNDENSIDVSALFSASEQRVTSQSLRGGKVSATFGSVVLDLGGAKLAHDPVLDVDVFMGSVELRVPDEWLVSVNGSPTFGNIEQSRPQPPETDGAPTLTVNASISFGSLEITRTQQ